LREYEIERARQLITVAEGIRESYADKIDGGIYNMQELKKM